MLPTKNRVAKLAQFGAVDEKFFDFHFDANVKGMFFTVEKGLPHMNDGGTIILTGSIAAIKGFPAMSVYSATKAARADEGGVRAKRPLGRMGDPDEIAKALRHQACETRLTD